MSLWRKWMERPQRLWLRRALFQVHLWSGIAIGLYVVVISITGSAIVFRNEIYIKYSRAAVEVPQVGERLNKAQIDAAARRAYPGHSVTFQSQPKNPAHAVEVWLEKDGKKKQRLFDPYTGRDMEDAISPMILWTAWLGDLHINLLAERTGRTVNGIGAILLTILSLTGLILWWPGVKRWKRNLGVNFRSNWKRINWDLHSAVGLWTFGLVFMWALTGVYVVFPEPFQRGINYFWPLDYYRLVDTNEPPAPVMLVKVADEAPQPPPPPRRPRVPRRRSQGDKILGGLYAAHFGNFGGWPVKALWTLLGLVPVLLFVTGVIMWWNRLLRKSAKTSAARSAVSVAA